MKCPVCAIDLKMSERQEIEIDYCPQCRGVWLDRGELDKIIERSKRASEEYSRKAEHFVKEHNSHHEYKKHKKKSFLEDLFD